MYTPEDIAAAQTWASAAARPDVAAALAGVYAMVATEVAARGPACWASGRCCNFRQAGHRLYVTGLEGAYALRGAPAAGARDIALIQLRAAGALERCPFLDGNACGIHTIKPLACRTYFCDGATREWQQELTERGLREVRALHDGFGLEYRYAEWGWVIGLLRASAG